MGGLIFCNNTFCIEPAHAPPKRAQEVIRREEESMVELRMLYLVRRWSN